MKGRRLNRWVSMLLILGLMTSLLAACNINPPQETERKQKGNMFSGTTSENEVPMGRYVEKEIEVPEGLERYLTFQVLENGNFQLVAVGEGETLCSYISSDKGESWEEMPGIAGNSIPDGYSFLAGAADKKGNIYLSVGKVKSENAWGAIVEGVYRYYRVTPEGETVEISLELPEPAAQEAEFGYGVRTFYTAENGDIIAEHMREGTPTKLYRISPEDGRQKQVYEMSSGSSVQVSGNTILELLEDKVIQYDLESGEEIGSLNLTKNDLAMALVTGGEDSGRFYIADASGIYRYGTDANVREQLVDGNTSSLSNGDLFLRDFIRTESGMFIAAMSEPYYDIHLVKYEYDENMETVPTEEISVYSLYDSVVVRKLVQAYQQEYPDVHVILETGLSAEDTGENTVNKTELLKILNTEIMAGNGPDVLILSGLPIQSYMEKGILADLTSVLEPQIEGGELYENIFTPYTNDGKYLAAPVLFKIPVLYGEKTVLEKVKGIDELTEHMQETYEKNGEKILPFISKRIFIKRLSEISMQDWIKDEKIEESGLQNFFGQCGNIYQIMKEEWESQEEMEKGIKNLKNREIYSKTQDENMHDTGDYLTMDLVGEEGCSLTFGYISDISNLVDMNYLMEKRNEMDYRQFDAGTVFYNTPLLAGVNAKAGNRERALDFISFLLSKEGQTASQMFDGYGLPVRREVYQEQIKEPSKAILDKMGTNREGFQWPQTEFFLKFESLMEQADTPVIQDDILFETLYEQLTAYMKGEKELAHAVADYKQKMDLYLAE